MVQIVIHLLSDFLNLINNPSLPAHNKQALIDNFNMVLDLGLPFVIRRTNKIEQTKKLDLDYYKVQTILSELPNKILQKTQDLFYIRNNKNKGLKTEILKKQLKSCMNRL